MNDTRPDRRDVLAKLPDQVVDAALQAALDDILSQAAEIHIALYGHRVNGGSSANRFIHRAESAWTTEASQWGWEGYPG